MGTRRTSPRTRRIPHDLPLQLETQLPADEAADVEEPEPLDDEEPEEALEVPPLDACDEEPPLPDFEAVLDEETLLPPVPPCPLDVPAPPPVAPDVPAPLPGGSDELEPAPHATETQAMDTASLWRRRNVASKKPFPTDALRTWIHMALTKRVPEDGRKKRFGAKSESTEHDAVASAA